MSNTMHYQWQRLSSDTPPPPRVMSCVAYDARHEVSLLFSGGSLSDTWTWDGAAWTQLYPITAPPARRSACMTYDAGRERMVLFGGVDNNGTPLNDTWTWDGTTWLQQHPATAPSARSGASMTYDAARSCVVLFGGAEAGRRYVDVLLNDTWTWDGRTWTRHAASISPPVRSGASMAYDVIRHTTVLFGGADAVDTFDDTWLWDGTRWMQAAPAAGPPARSWASMVFSLVSQQVVLLGGDGFDSGLKPLALGDTWTWNGVNWTRQATAAPVGAFFCATYDVARQNIIVYVVAGSRPFLGNKSTTPGLLPHVAGNKPGLTSETWVWAQTWPGKRGVDMLETR